MRNVFLSALFLAFILSMRIDAMAYAHSLQTSLFFTACYSSQTVANTGDENNSEYDSFVSTQPVSSAQRPLKIKLIETEIEEELITSRKYAQVSDYFVAILIAFGFLLRLPLSRIAFSQRYPFLTAYRWYILFLVFRI